MLTRRAFVASAAFAVLACGCSSGAGKTAPTTTEKASATTTRPTSKTQPLATTTRPVAATTTTTIAIPGPPLESLILVTAPSAFPRKADSLADTGPTNLEKAVIDDALSNESDARQALTAGGFLRGYQRQWSTADGIGQNFLYVYQFATPAGAMSILAHWRSAVIAGASRAAPVDFTPALPGAIGAIGLKANDVRGSSGVVLFSKGPYAVEAVATGGPGIDQSAPTTALAFAQYALLP